MNILPAFPPDVNRALRDSATLELFSVGNPGDAGTGRFFTHWNEGWPVLGSADLEGELRQAVIDKLHAMLRWGAAVPFKVKCHYPHHVVRAGEVHISICFHCWNIRYPGNAGHPNIARLDGRSFFNRIFRDRGIPLPPL